MILARFAIAELAAAVSYLAFKSSPLSLFIPPEVGLVLFLLPLLGLPFGRPFSSAVLLVFILFSISPVLANSESFDAALDAAYYLGFRNQAETVYSAFSSYDGSFTPIAAVVALYVVSEVLGGVERRIRELKARGVEVRGAGTMYAFSAAITAAALYVWSLLRPFAPELTPLLAGLAGALLFLAAAILAAR